MSLRLIHTYRHRKWARNSAHLKFNIALMVMGTLMGRMGLGPIYPEFQPELIVFTSIACHDGPNFGVGTCEQDLKKTFLVEVGQVLVPVSVNALLNRIPIQSLL